MAHQTFYIDIDEEITSIVDRLRKAKSDEVVIVVPKRAILIQSIVNLKLLKKEADGLKKDLIIVTQDKFGKMLIEKAGIAVEQRLDDIEGQEIVAPENNFDDNIKINVGQSAAEPKNTEAKKRLDKIGSDGYYQAEDLDALIGREAYVSEPEEISKNQEIGEKITNKELVVDMGNDLRKQQPSFRKNAAKRGSYAPMDLIRNVEISEEDFAENTKNIKPAKKGISKSSRNSFKQEEMPVFDEEPEIRESKVKKVGNFFEHNRNAGNDDEYKSINVGKGVWKYFVTLSIIVAVVILGAAAYLFLPKASITVFAKNKIQAVDAQIDGAVSVTSVDPEKGLIPARIISVSDEMTKSYDTTGSKNSSNQKAHGMVTIYNEFSTSPQPLVATTRFASPDGKIFRLVSGVTVPGMQSVGGQATPGAIEAEVIADEAGEAYNIDATSFTIPGFQSSGADKYSKIYAKSFKAMVGGGQGNQTIKTVTDTDINSAKTKVAQELKPEIIQKLKDSAGSDYVLLDDATNVDDSTYTLSNSAGDAVDSFSITVKMNYSAIVFKKDEAKSVVTDLIAKKGANGARVSNSSINMEFGKSDTNFKDGTITIRVHGSGNIVPDIDLEKLKAGLLGKREDELKAYLSAFSDIDRVEVSYWPSFLSGKIPAYASRVNIMLDKN